MRGLGIHPTFLNSKDLTALGNHLKGFADKYEKPSFQYEASREDRDTRAYLPNPISYFISQLASKKNQKLRVLDLGAGSCRLTDELRSRFRDIKVFSTGLSPKVAEATRRGSGLGRLHRDDLICQSIEQMRNYPEFDLIFSIYGELHYGPKSHPLEECDSNKLKNKLDALIRKLNPGGLGIVSPILDHKGLKDVVKELLQSYGIDIQIYADHLYSALLIQKSPIAISEDYCNAMGFYKSQ